MSFEQEQYEQIDFSYIFKVIWHFVKKYKLVFGAILLFIFVIELLSLAENLVFKYIVDNATLLLNDLITKDEFRQSLFLALGIYLAITLASSLGWFYKIRLLNRAEARSLSDLERFSFWHVINLSYRFHINRKTGSIISQFTRGVSKTESLIDAFVFNFAPTIFRLLFSISVVLYFDRITAFVLAVTSLLFVLTGYYFTNLQRVPQNIANYREDYLKQNLSDTFVNIETVKYFGKEKNTSNYFDKLSRALKRSRVKCWDYYASLSSIQTFVLGAGIAVTFYFSFTGFLHDRLTLGTITLIYASLWKLIPQLSGLIHGYRELIRSGVDVSALYNIFKEKNEVVDGPNARELKVGEGEVKYETVSFTYPKYGSEEKGEQEIILENFDLLIKPNTKVALVGPSGGGKSTVVKLLYRLFDLDRGKIMIDGQDISQITQRSLRSSLSIVPQEPILFDNSIYYNVAYANKKASRKDVWKAIKFAQLDKLIERLPDKEKTIVGERGIKLSGGEKQRISIARAILANKKILILDEATSALDSATEKQIQAALEKLMQGRTTIIIAHRLSTIMKADKIIVLSRGKIVEKGSHDQLKNKEGGLYRKLWELQRGSI